jgi:hypothetical protein
VRLWIIDYRCKGRKIFGELRGDIGAICFTPNPDHHPQKKKKQRSVQPGDAFADTTFKPWLEIVKF